MTNSVAIFYSVYYLQLRCEDQSCSRRKQGQDEQWTATSQQCMGSRQVKKHQKIQEKLGLVRSHTDPPPYPIFYFFCQYLET